MSGPSGLVFVLSLVAMRSQPAPPAASAPFELLWSAPAQCPGAAAARASIERHLGKALGAELGHGMRVSVAVERGVDDAWRTTIGFDGPRGLTVRELVVATDCSRAVDAAALVVAIAIDPSLALAPEPLPEPPEPPEPQGDPTVLGDVPPDPAAHGVAAPPPVADLPPRRPRSIRGAIGIVAGPTFGGLPRTGGLARLHGAVLSRRWRVELGAAFASAPVLATGGARLSVQRVVGDVRGCAVLGPRPWLELHGCGGVEVGASLARADGLTTSSPRRDLSLGFLLAPRVLFVVAPRVALSVGGDVVAPVFRREYTVAGIGTLHKTTVVTGAVLAGIEVRLQADRP